VTTIYDVIVICQRRRGLSEHGGRGAFLFKSKLLSMPVSVLEELKQRESRVEWVDIYRFSDCRTVIVSSEQDRIVLQAYTIKR